MKISMMLFRLFLIPTFILSTALPVWAGSDGAGSVIAARREAWVERLTDKELLASKSFVFSGDTLNTNNVGRLQVLFNDDSILMLAPNSQATVTEYVYTGGKADNFNIKLASGVTSLISGRMVEANPGSMQVETLEAIIGIHGTDLIVSRDVTGAKPVTSVYLIEGSLVSVTKRNTDEMISMITPQSVLLVSADGAMESRKFTEEDRDFIGKVKLQSLPPQSQPFTDNQPMAEMNKAVALDEMIDQNLNQPNNPFADTGANRLDRSDDFVEGLNETI